ncbi:MAG: hypothetical protein ACQESR_30825 [Planctomycetota bacterium]
MRFPERLWLVSDAYASRLKPPHLGLGTPRVQPRVLRRQAAAERFRVPPQLAAIERSRIVSPGGPRVFEDLWA